MVTDSSADPCPQEGCQQPATHEIVMTGHNSQVRIGPMCADHILERMIRANPKPLGDYVKVEIESII